MICTVACKFEEDKLLAKKCSDFYVSCRQEKNETCDDSVHRTSDLIFFAKRVVLPIGGKTVKVQPIYPASN